MTLDESLKRISQGGFVAIPHQKLVELDRAIFAGTLPEDAIRKAEAAYAMGNWDYIIRIVENAGAYSLSGAYKSALEAAIKTGEADFKQLVAAMEQYSNSMTALGQMKPKAAEYKSEILEAMAAYAVNNLRLMNVQAAETDYGSLEENYITAMKIAVRIGWIRKEILADMKTSCYGTSGSPTPECFFMTPTK